MLQAAHLENWETLEEEHSNALTGCMEALESAILRVPVTGGARVSGASGGCVGVAGFLWERSWVDDARIWKATSLAWCGVVRLDRVWGYWEWSVVQSGVVVEGCVRRSVPVRVGDGWLVV